MIIPVHLQWELDPAQLPYQQWFSTTGLRQQLTNEKTWTGQANNSAIANGCDTSFTNHPRGSAKASTTINEHEVRLYIASRHPEQWDTIGSIWLPDDGSLDTVEQGSRFWLWEGEMLAVVTVMEYRMEGFTYPSWMCLAGDWNREAAPIIADFTTDAMKPHHFLDRTSRPLW
ncbi:hypothetical protein SK066_22155 [Paenibacillus hunanensis]|uniref:hypothetical protein n=1 Tax=Paenibacillus hunanensis TaxID=539262 RepID=UPI002A6B0D8B|nr:hypothetical protein [Paenibacillus hunanensis]WPP41226.1 hypothetical protein SK066_22155 [Paenibacillus hunanensis]